MNILVVDDEPAIRTGLAHPLTDAGHHVMEAVDGAAALALIANQVFDVVICDVRLPKIDGLTLLRRLHEDSPSTAVILMTAYAKANDAIAALRGGAYDYVTKPFDDADFPISVIGRIEQQQSIARELREARQQLSSQSSSAIIGRSPPMMRLLERLDTVAQSDAPVLITGESGTGKELIARTLHQRSGRARSTFVAVNCAALPEALIEAELFGHERGAFTGAVRKRDGRFKLADGGTLLLDEIAEMSLSAQTKLLRVLQEGTIEPIGSNATLRVDVRIISATHQNLKERVADGRFREDLYYRLNVLDLQIPPLRERRSDLPLLLEHFLRSFAPPGKSPPTITPRAWIAISKHDFPGNVREFAHMIERASVLSRGGEIDLEHLPADVSGRPATAHHAGGTFQPLVAAMKGFERAYLVEALELAGGKRGRAADLLGISRKSLWEKLRAYGIGQGRDEQDGPSDD